MPEAAPQRRQVSVLFLDVVGSTDLTRRLDPEDVSEVMDGALRSFAAVVERLDGRVLQYAGDSMLAAFGADGAREDDAERAVHAGLALLGAAREHAALVRREHRVDGFDVRVGVHTGHVLLGGGVDADGTIRGFTVNVAARLEQTAPPGTLRISQETWHQVRGAFEGERQPPITVKGHDEPLVTWLVTRALPRHRRGAGRGVEGVDSAFVGRDRELAALLAIARRSAGDDAARAATLLADAGLGKSRLLHELERALRDAGAPPRVLRARSQPGDQHQPYGLLRDLLARELQIADSESGEAARARLVEGLAAVLAGDDAEQALREAELVGQLVGMDFSASPRLAEARRDSRLLRDGALDALAKWLTRLAARDGAAPVLVLDDVHWSDDASLDLFEMLHQRAALPAVLLFGARPSLLERRPQWRERERHVTVALAPLDAQARGALLRGLLQRLGAIPPELETLVDGQAEGNPYYAEELVQMLVDVGVIDTSGERWQVQPERLAAARVPGTLVGVLQARLDALAASERRSIQAASVVGPVFWDDALAAVDAAAVASLPALRAKTMVETQPQSAFEGTDEERFHHHLLHQVTYETLLKPDRRAGHAQVAAWLAGHVGDRMAEYLALTAEHYERAGDTGKAIDWLERAALAAKERFANAMALSTLARLLAMPELDADPRRRFRLLGRQAMVADLVGDRDVQAAAIAGKLAIAEALDDDALRAEALWGRALLADRTSRLHDAQADAEAAARLAVPLGLAATAALALGELGWLQHLRGEMAQAEATIDTALQWARQAAQRDPHDEMYPAMLLNLLALVRNEAHDYEGALAALDEALAEAEARHLPRIAATCYEVAFTAARRLGDFPRARRHLDAMEETARRIGLRAVLASVPVNRGRLALAEGDTVEAVALCARGAETLDRLGDRRMTAEARSAEARARLAADEPLGACACFEAAIDAFVAAGIEDDAHNLRIELADALRAAADPVRARAVLEPEVAWLAAESPDGADDHVSIEARMAGWRTLAALGDPRAGRQLERAGARVRRIVSRVADPARRARMLQVQPLRDVAAACAAVGTNLANT
jgi:class 3 adenylate cyclase/predicted ATPase